MIQHIEKESYILWQTDPQDRFDEPPIIITPHYDNISLSQSGKSIIVSYDSVKELFQFLESIKPPNPKKSND